VPSEKRSEALQARDTLVARYLRTEGVCLRRLAYSNTSQVATFLTRDAGRLSFLARGILRAPRRGIRTGLQLLCRYELFYLPRRHGSLERLTESALLEPFHGIRGAIERILCAYYAGELVLNFTAEAEPCTELYCLLLDTLRSIQRGRQLGLSILRLEIGTLRHHGTLPTFDVCLDCGRRLPAEGRLLFALADGGPLCPECGRRLYPRPAPGVVPVKAERLRLLAALCRPGPWPARVAPRETVAASRLLRLHMRHLLGKELRMWRYLQGRHMSRTLGRLRRLALRPRQGAA